MHWGLKYFDSPLQDLESLPKVVITIVLGINLQFTCVLFNTDKGQSKAHVFNLYVIYVDFIFVHD